MPDSIADTDTERSKVLASRLALWRGGYLPIPLFGKTPPVYGKNNNSKGLGRWQKLETVSYDTIEMWGRTWPDAINTGVLTRLTPALDLDLLNDDAARAAEDYVRERYEEGGYVLTRIGRAPKRAILFRTDEPFAKIVVNLVAPNGSAEKIEFLADGQQVACFGIHPDTGKPYSWHGGSPGEIAREDLPYIREAEAKALVEALVELLVADFGYVRRRKSAKAGNGQDDPTGTSGDGNFWHKVNDMAFANLGAWVPVLFPSAEYQQGTGAYRISSESLGRDLEEDLSISPKGAKDFGVHDMGDAREGKRTAIDIVVEHGNVPDATAAALWLCEQLGVDPASLGWKPPPGPEPGPEPGEPEPPPGPGAGPTKIKGRFQLVPFNDIKIDTTPNYLVKGIIPRGGLVVVWGPPKCGKSFWTFDLVMHVALGRRYRGRRVQPGAIVYLALEGGNGFRARVETWRRQHLASHQGDVPFYLMSASIDLVRDHRVLVASIQTELGDIKPDAVVIDTLNRALTGDENSSEDMARFIRAADTIREAFACAAIIVHHCGIQGTRPRGHTSLTGAVDAQIAVDRTTEDGGIITATVEHMKDGQDGGVILSRLEQVELGYDDDGDRITSCIIVAVEGDAPAKRSAGKLSDNDKLALDALKRAMAEKSHNPIPQSGTFRVCPVEVWRLYFYGVKGGDRGTQKKAFQRARDKLQTHGSVSTWEDSAWLAGHAGHGGTFAGHVPAGTSGTGRDTTPKGVPACPAALSPSRVPPFRVIATTKPGTFCVRCHSAEGEVMKFVSGEPGAKAEPLHQMCAAKWFAGEIDRTDKNLHQGE